MHSGISRQNEEPRRGSCSTACSIWLSKDLQSSFDLELGRNMAGTFDTISNCLRFQLLHMSRGLHIQYTLTTSNLDSPSRPSDVCLSNRCDYITTLAFMDRPKFKHRLPLPNTKFQKKFLLSKSKLISHWI